MYNSAKKIYLRHKEIITGIIISLLFFIVNASLINDYAFSWDFHYHHYAGRFHLGLPVPKMSDPAPVPFTPPDPRLTLEDPFGPFTDIIPSLFHHLLFEKFHLLAEDSAYNFPIIIFGSLGVATIYFFLLESLGFYHAVVGSIALALLPVYIGYTHNDMKDIPNAFGFALSLYLFWRLAKYRRVRDLIWASIVFAIAFNIKINSIVIPVICFVWVISCQYLELVVIPAKAGIQYLLNSGSRIKSGMTGKIVFEKKLFIILLYFLLAPLFALMLWWPFWQHPIQKLLELPHFYSNNTVNMPVLFNGTILRSGVNIPFYYPFVYLGITIPIPILLFFVIGLCICIKNWKNKNGIYSLILIWFFIPLVRYISPKSGAIDGVRHFLEVVYPVCALAAVGYATVIKKKNTINYLITIGILVYLVSLNIYYHPYQTSYFNAFVGGIQGASGKYDIDFWGTPQKEAVLWLNKIAPPSATVHIVMAQSSAAMYLRDDLRVIANTKDYLNSDFVILLNRESFFYVYPVMDFKKTRELEGKVIFTKKIDGVPLVWIFKK